MFKSTLYGLSCTAAFLYIPTTAFAQEALDEIIVTGSPLTRSVDEAITGVSVLTGDELANRLASTIGETLKSEPGVSSTFFGAGASRPIIRGQGGDRVRVLSNGIGSIDASSASPDHAVAVEPAQAKRIEVLRGASLLRYGSSGSGGIVNVIDGRIPTEIPDGVDGAVRLGASSVDNGYEAAGSLNFGAGNFVFHIDGTYKDAENYDIPGFAESSTLRALEEAEAEAEGEEHDEEEEAFGTLENSQAESDSYTVGASYIGSKGFFGIALHEFSADYGVPGGHEEEEGLEEEEEEEVVTIALDQTRIDVNGAIELEGFIEKVQFFGGYADYKHTEFEGPGEVGTIFTNEGYEARLEAIQTEKNGWSAAHGLQYRERDFEAVGEEAFVPPTTTQQYGIYSFHELEINNFHLEGAGRYERTDQNNSISDDEISFDLISLSAGGDIHLSDTVRLGGTVFRTERAPTTEELFSNGPHLATNQFERGNIDLGKETATGIEAAFRHKADGHYLTVNAFYTDYDDYIFEVPLNEEEDGLPVFQFGADDASFKGFEIQGGFDVGTLAGFDIEVDALAEYVRAKTDTGNLPRIPPLSILTGIEASNDDLTLRAELDYADEQTKVQEFNLPTDDYALVNLFATWNLPISFQNETNMKLNVSVLNVFDESARQHTSFLKDVVPLPGRNFRIAFTAAF